MTDKEKRIQKFLTKVGLKGKLKSVKTLEEATVVVVEDPRDRVKNVFYDRAQYQITLERSGPFPADQVHFLTSTNPRNKGQVERGIFTKAKGSRKLPEFGEYKPVTK